MRGYSIPLIVGRLDEVLASQPRPRRNQVRVPITDNGTAWVSQGDGNYNGTGTDAVDPMDRAREPIFKYDGSIFHPVSRWC